MIVINLTWVPFIATVVLSLITGIVNGFESEPQNDLAFILFFITGTVAVISIIIYIVLGIIWLFTHVKLII